jgi:hypothetical protein
MKVKQTLKMRNLLILLLLLLSSCTPKDYLHYKYLDGEKVCIEGRQPGTVINRGWVWFKEERVAAYYVRYYDSENRYQVMTFREEDLSLGDCK